MTLERLARSTSQSNEGSPRLQLGPSGWRLTGYVRWVQSPLQDVSITIVTWNIPVLAFKALTTISFADERWCTVFYQEHYTSQKLFPKRYIPQSQLTFLLFIHSNFENRILTYPFILKYFLGLMVKSNSFSQIPTASWQNELFKRYNPCSLHNQKKVPPFLGGGCI